jgi:hypothetical protein
MGELGCFEEKKVTMLFRGDLDQRVLNNFLQVAIVFHLSEKIFLGET